MEITWIGQSGYLLTDGATEICIDPYLSNVVDRIAHRGRMVEADVVPLPFYKKGMPQPEKTK